MSHVDAQAVREEIQETKDDLKEARQDAQHAKTPAERSAADARVDALEGRVNDLQTAFADLKAGHEAKAERDHEHPMPGELKAVHEHLQGIVSEERSPARRHWFNKRIGGG